MAAALRWLVRPLKLSDTHKKSDYEHCPTSDGELQKGSSRAEIVAAVRRILYIKQLVFANIGAQDDRQFHATGAEAVALKKSVDQLWGTFQEIVRHECELYAARDLGRDIDFDEKFWWDHKTLLVQLPEAMRPAAAASTAAGHLNACKESATSIRKREHCQSATMVV